jgi:hypothetical protein
MTEIYYDLSDLPENYTPGFECDNEVCMHRYKDCHPRRCNYQKCTPLVLERKHNRELYNAALNDAINELQTVYPSKDILTRLTKKPILDKKYLPGV